MKRCVFLLALASVSVWGQDQPPAVRRNLDPDLAQSLKEKLFGSQGINLQPLIFTQPREVFRLETRPPVDACVVPLLVVPVDPNIDPKMILHLPESATKDKMIVKGLPPCPDNRSK